MDKSKLKASVEAFKEQNILVIGDVILDVYYEGAVNRVSPEAPVPILEVTSKRHCLGGAANVALNLKTLGANPILAASIGSDLAGNQVLQLMEQQQLDSSALVASSSRQTTTKTRLVSAQHQLMRIDEEQRDPLNAEDRQHLIDALESAFQSHQIDAVIFEDYDKGVIDPVLIEWVMKVAHRMDIPVAVDPKKRNFLSYAGATLFKPNLKELKEGLNMLDLEVTPHALRQSFQFLCDVMPVKYGLFTLSQHGVFITDGTEDFLQPALPRSIADVSGAGDTVISTATCALAVGCSLEEIAMLSNLAGGYVCQYPGVVAISGEALTGEIEKMLN